MRSTLDKGTRRTLKTLSASDLELELMILGRIFLLAAALCLLMAPGQELFAQFAPSARQTAAAESLPFVSPIFGDDMVLQRGKSDAIWGWSEPGDTAHVQIGQQSASGGTGSDRRWQVKIQPPAAGGPSEPTIGL